MRRCAGLLAASTAAVIAASSSVACASPRSAAPAARGRVAHAGSSARGAHAARVNAVNAVNAVNVSNPVRALTTARRGNPRALAYSIDRERFRGSPVWEVGLVRPQGRALERLVGVQGRHVVRRSTTPRPAMARQARQARVHLAPALRTAARRGRGHLEGADIDRERGQVVWSVIFLRGGAETEVYVSVRTGRVILVEHDH